MLVVIAGRSFQQQHLVIAERAAEPGLVEQREHGRAGRAPIDEIAQRVEVIALLVEADRVERCEQGFDASMDVAAHEDTAIIHRKIRQSGIEQHAQAARTEIQHQQEDQISAPRHRAGSISAGVTQRPARQSAGSSFAGIFALHCRRLAQARLIILA